MLEGDLHASEPCMMEDSKTSAMLLADTGVSIWSERDRSERGMSERRWDLMLMGIDIE